MTTSEISFFKFKLRKTILSNDIFKKIRQKWLEKCRNLSEEKTHPEHKYSVTFVTKAGTKITFCGIWY